MEGMVLKLIFFPFFLLGWVRSCGNHDG